MCNQYGPNPWTPERVATLSELWAEGLSASQIARQMGQFRHCKDGGRNAVIGKVHRLGLQQRASRARPARYARPAPARVMPVSPPRVYSWRTKPKPKPVSKPKPAPVLSTDPAALVAAALIANADAAQRRRDGFRATERSR